MKIGIVGKYFGTGNFILTDSYISVIEAIKHAAYFYKVKPIIEWIDAEEFEKNPPLAGRSLPSARRSPRKLKELSKYQGIIIPGGFGSRGVEGKIAVIKYLRLNKIPFLGLCYGMQLSVIEYSRSVVGLKNAHTTEVNPETPHPVIDILPEQKSIWRIKITAPRCGWARIPRLSRKNNCLQRLQGVVDFRTSSPSL